MNSNLPSRSNTKSRPNNNVDRIGRKDYHHLSGQHRSCQYCHDGDVDYDQEQTNDERRLFNYLMRNYDSTVRPVLNASSPINIRLGITLTQIFDLVGVQLFWELEDS